MQLTTNPSTPRPEGMLVYGSKNEAGKLPYNPVTVVMLVSFVKLGMAARM